MKTPYRIMIVLAGFIFLIGGCSSSGIKVNQDYEPSMIFSDLKSFALKTPGQDETVGERSDNPLINDRIHKALNRSLSENGYTPVNTKPDFLVVYQYLIQTKISSDANSSAIGIG
ncbi:DUF4136 domain-containing protein, partial [bacterium]|nr:DUF4136 domain-containing protein [bacterium]